MDSDHVIFLLGPPVQSLVSSLYFDVDTNSEDEELQNDIEDDNDVQRKSLVMY
jgi:hypothetical protein